MIDKELSQKVLTIGCRCVPPRGGIGQVLWNYKNYVFEEFNYIKNSRTSNRVNNLLIAIRAAAKTIFWLSRDKNIKIVHLHASVGISFIRAAIFMRIAKCFKRKVVMHIHGGAIKDYYDTHKSLVEKTLSKCDTIITLSQEWVDFYKSIGFESISVENVITSPIIKPQEDDGLLHVLYLGLIIDYKGIYDLVDVIGDHQEEYRGKLLLHIGGNGEIDFLTKKIESYGIGDIVEFEGWVAEEKKIQLMNQCKVFILPSYHEGLPLSILEAMSYNMAVISTRVGGIPSLVTSGENGVLIESGDKEALHKSLKTFVDEPLTLDNMRKDNSKNVVAYYPESVAKKLTSIYNSLLEDEPVR